MLRTLHALSTLSATASPSHHFPPIFLCIERRDSLLVDCFLGDAQKICHYNVERIPHKKLRKAVEWSGLHWSRTDLDWEDIGLWKPQMKRDLSLQGAKYGEFRSVMLCFQLVASPQGHKF